MNRPNKTEALSGYRLRVAYPDGTAGVIDLSADVGRGVFAPLADEEFFQTVHIGRFGQIAWSEDIEICPDAAYQEITGRKESEGQAVVVTSLQDYETLEETAYLLKNPKNAKRIMSAITQLDMGKGVSRTVDLDA